MRNNARLISCYLMAMLLVNFYGTLILTTQKVVRQKEPRRLAFLLKIIRNLLTSFIKLIFAAFAILMGALMIFVNIFLIWVCVLPFSPKCPIIENIEGGAILVAVGFAEIWDVKRIMWNDAMKDNQKFFSFTDRRLAAEERSLTQTPNAGSIDPSKLNFAEFPETTSSQIVESNAKDSFDKGREFLKKLKQMDQLLMSIREKESCRVLTNPLDPQCATIYNQAKAIFKETTDGRAELYRKKIRRIVICSINMMIAQVEAENNPEKFPPEKKKQLEEIMKVAKGTDAKAKEKAKEDLKEILAKLSDAKESKNKVGENFLMLLIHNGMTFNDAKSTYGSEMIAAGFMAFAQQKMNAIKADPAMKTALTANKGSGIDLDEFDKNMAKTNQLKIPDNSSKLLKKAENTVESDEDLKSEENE